MDSKSDIMQQLYYLLLFRRGFIHISILNWSENQIIRGGLFVIQRK